MTITAADLVSFSRLLLAQVMWQTSGTRHECTYRGLYSLAIAADAFDGYISRRSQAGPSEHGEFIDVFCDRLTEQTSWLAAHRNGGCSSSFAITAMLARHVVTDLARTVTSRYAQTSSMRPQLSGKTAFLVTSTESKAAYNLLKLVTMLDSRRGPRATRHNIQEALLLIYAYARAYPYLRSAITHTYGRQHTGSRVPIPPEYTIQFIISIMLLCLSLILARKGKS